MKAREFITEGFYDSDPVTYDLPRRMLNVPELIRRGAIFVTYPHDTSGWETDAQEDWQLGVISLYNVAHGGWSVEAKKHLKPASYKKAEQQINSSAPNLGSDKLIYDGKYNQILWSIKKLGIPDNVAFLDDKQAVAEGEAQNINNSLDKVFKENNIQFDSRGERSCTIGRMEFVFWGDHFFFFPNGRNATHYSVYQVHKRHANRVGEINYNKEIEEKLPNFTVPWFRQWAIEKMSDRIVYENIRQYVYNWAKTQVEKQAVSEGLDQSLSSMAGQEQAERNAYGTFVKSQMGGDYTKGQEVWAKLKNRPRNDVFGDAVRQDKFMKMKFDFDKFTDKDWADYWVMAQHCDKNRDFQKNALSMIKKYQGTDHKNYKFLYDRISMGLTGKQKYGTQNGPGYTGEFN